MIERDTLYIAVSQSGETFDTLAAVQEIKRKGGRIMGIVNVVGSTIARECGRGVYLHAGPEVAVVSTKTFTCTAVALALLAIHLGRLRDLSVANGARLIDGAAGAARSHRAILEREPEIAQLAERFEGVRARLLSSAAPPATPIACEGALKLKEISYLHAEAYPASELKHGPLALIEPETPTVIVLPRDDLLRQEHVDGRGDQGARRAGDRHHPSRRAADGLRRRVRGARARARARSAAAQHPAAAARLSRGAAARHQHRPAAQPGEVRHRRMRRQSRRDDGSGPCIHRPALTPRPGWFSRTPPPRAEDLLAKQGFLKSALAGAAGLWRKGARTSDFTGIDDPDPERQGQVLFRRGRYRMRAGDLAAALQDFDHAIELLPDFADAVAARAECLDMMGKAETAQPD